MSAAAPPILVRRGLDPGLAMTVLASAALHALALIALVLAPAHFLRPVPKLESYTVDLVAPDVLGGTNLIPGGGRAKVEPAKPVRVAAPEPPPAAVEPQSAPKAVAPPPAEPAKAGPPPVPEAPKAIEPPKAVEPPKAAEPKPPPPKPVEAAKAPPKPEPPVAAKPIEAKPLPKPPAAEPPKVAAKPEAPKPVAAERPAPAPKPQAAQSRPEVQKSAPAAETEAQRLARQRDQAIAAAVQRRAGAAQSSSAAEANLDKQIAAAVQRRAQQVGAGTGTGAPGPGGPIGVGPGTGVGGTAAGLEYILYQGRMEQKIKSAWAWAGTEQSLEATIGFNLTPEGQIQNIHTIKSSGDRQYDASCERAVRAANPLEPVPEKYRKEFASVEMTFKPSDLGR
jgi:protein TonB